MNNLKLTFFNFEWVKTGRIILTVVLILMTAIICGEIMRRILDGYSLTDIKLKKTTQKILTSSHSARDDLLNFAKNVIENNGPGIPFFNQDPVNKIDFEVPEQLKLRVESSPQSRYHVNFVYNDAFIRGRDGKSYIKDDFPEELFTFTSPDGSIFPRYRHYPSAQLSLGLKMNAHGWRSEEIALDKPSNTIRIAALGDSTTMHQGGVKISYLDYLEFWLEKWAQQKGYNIKIETLNTGREAISSEDVRAIFKYEVLPFEPDYVLFYGLGNQWDISPYVNFVNPVKPGPYGARDFYKNNYYWGVVSDFFSPIQDHSATASWAIKRLQTNVGDDGMEPQKPSQNWNFPSSLNERSPDPDNLLRGTGNGRMIKDLDAILNMTKESNSRLFIQTFKFIASDGLFLPQPQSQGIFNYLNYAYFPYSYKYMDRAIQYTNRIYQSWAIDRKVPLIDVASGMPNDYRLFVDGMHNTQIGVKLRAWIVFQQILPAFETDLKLGNLPREDEAYLKAHPFPLKVITVPKKEIMASH